MLVKALRLLHALTPQQSFDTLARRAGRLAATSEEDVKVCSPRILRGSCLVAANGTLDLAFT